MFMHLIHAYFLTGAMQTTAYIPLPSSLAIFALALSIGAGSVAADARAQLRGDSQHAPPERMTVKTRPQGDSATGEMPLQPRPAAWQAPWLASVSSGVAKAPLRSTTGTAQAGRFAARLLEGSGRLSPDQNLLWGTVGLPSVSLWAENRRVPVALAGQDAAPRPQSDTAPPRNVARP